MELEHGHSPDEVAARLAQDTNSARLQDGVLGAIDGTVTTFAIVAGVQGAGLAPGVIVALGLANVLADGFSMAAGNYSGTKAMLDDRRRLEAVEQRHVAVNPEGEREELRQILGRWGLSGRVLVQATTAISRDKSKWISLMLTEEYGLPPGDPKPMAAALVTFAAFLIAGAVPLLPFVLGLSQAFTISAIAAGVVFFGIGAAKARWSLAPWWRSGLETFAIGAVAAGIAYVVGSMFHA